MPTFKVKANEMTEATVSHISLVDRGANRIPFKIVKQEKSGMSAKHFASLDLRNLFVRKNEEQVEKEDDVEIVGVVTMDDDEEAKKLIAEAGFSTSVSKVMEDGSVVYAQVEDETPKDKLSVLKWTDNVALVLKGFSPYMMDVGVGDGSFTDKCKAQGFYPGIRTVTETIVESINAIVAKSEDPGEAAAQVATLCDEARDYITSLVGSLPVKAFKIEKPMEDGEDPKKKKKKPVDESADSSSSCKDDSDKSVTEDVVKAFKTKKVKEPVDGEEPVEEPVKEEPDPAEEETEVVPEGDTEVEDDAEEVPPADKKKKKPVVKQGLTIEDISSIVTTKMDESISKLVGLFDKRLDAISSRVEKAEAAVVETNGKLKGVLVPGSDSGDPSPTQKSEKGNGVFGGRDIDTAFQPGIRNRVR